MSYEKLFNADISDEYVRAWKAQGRKAVGVICCHVPVELFHALDILPVRIRATGTEESPDGDTWLSSFSCSYSRGMLQSILDGRFGDLDGVIASDGCMMASRAYDNAEHINKKFGKGKLYFQFGAPRKCGDLEHDFFVGELKDLIEQLDRDVAAYNADCLPALCFPRLDVLVGDVCIEKFLVTHVSSPYISILGIADRNESVRLLNVLHLQYSALRGERTSGIR